jgi:DNA ligase (NAD+)
LARLIFALGIRHVGQKAAYTLAEEFGDMQKLMHAKLEDLDSIPEIGQVMAGSILNYFNLKQTRKLIQDLKDAGVNMRQLPGNFKTNKLTGKTVVFTGELAGFSRAEAEDLVRRSKGVPGSSISSKTDILVAGANAGTKFNKARKLEVKIIDEEEFKEMIR